MSNLREAWQMPTLLPLGERHLQPQRASMYSNPISNDVSHRTPSPKTAYSERRSSQNIRRSSLEPVLEGEVRTADNRRHSVGHDARASQPKPNLAKSRTPSSGRSPHRNSVGNRRESTVRSESLLSVDIRTNVVVRISPISKGCS